MESANSIEKGMQFLNENFDTLSDEGYRKLYLKLVNQFLKEEFDVEDVNALSEKAQMELYEKLISIEIEESDKEESDKDEEDYSARGQLASAIIAEMGTSFSACRQLPHDSERLDDAEL